MPRVAGQIDQQKREAILEATAQVVGQRGLSAPIEVIARVAKVSKQTIYNHYGSKSQLLQAMVARRAEQMTDKLDMPEAEDSYATLVNFGLEVLAPLLESGGASIMRATIMGANEWPGLADQIYAAGPEIGNRRLADYLRRLHERGVLEVDDAYRASAFFIGMVAGRVQLQSLLRVTPWVKPSQARALCQEAVRRFMRAYAPA